jgi:hypothetical protein
VKYQPSEAFDVLMPMAPWESPSIVSEALASLEDQSLQPAQVIVSCDGPPPPELRQILMVSRLPLLIVEGPGREGVGPVLARGMDYCRSELVVRADADDISVPQRCLLQVKTMVQRPELAAISSWIDEFLDHPFETISIRQVPIGVVEVRRFSRWRNPMNHPAVIMRQSMVRQVGGYLSCPGFEDYYLWLRLLGAGLQLDNCADSLVKVRVGSSHTARRNGWPYLQAEARFLFRCAREGLLDWPQTLLLAVLRLPIRLVPVPAQTTIMRELLRRSGTRDIEQ